MKDLLLAIQDRLQARLDYIRPGDVVITPDIDALPDYVSYPCLAVTDGDIGKEELVGDMIETRLTLTIAVYVRLYKPEASMVGDPAGPGAGSAKGVLEICADVDQALDGWMPAGNYTLAWSPGSTAAVSADDGTNALARKTITFKYQKEEAR